MERSSFASVVPPNPLLVDAPSMACPASSQPWSPFTPRPARGAPLRGADGRWWRVLLPTLLPPPSSPPERQSSAGSAGRLCMGPGYACDGANSLASWGRGTAVDGGEERLAGRQGGGREAAGSTGPGKQMPEDPSAGA